MQYTEAKLVWYKTVNHKKVGDAHRDAGQWHQAEEAYRRYLVTKPHDAGIWVQYGHVLREQGKLEQAEVAYETSTSLAPDQPDGWLQLGHTLKALNKHAAALDAFRQAQRAGTLEDLDPVVRALSFSLKLSLDRKPATHSHLFSIQDMFAYLKVHPTMSGIQRSQAGLALELLANSDVDAGLIVTDFSQALELGTFWLLEPESVRDVIEYALGDRVDRVRLRRLLAIAEQKATPVTAGGGTTIVLLGAFWGHGNTVENYLPAKRLGARIALYLYDLIPVSHPEYCEPALVREFVTALSEWCLVCDYVLTISDFTRNALESFLAGHGIRPIPAATVPLAHALPGQREPIKTWPRSLLRLKDRPYVAYVSTIEGRKNHTYVVNVWRELMAQGVEVPDLLFVGRHGWRNSGLMDLLDGTRHLDGRVHIIHDLTDAELNAVYENSLFTVFISLVEGWGLPVGESLMHGTPCVASSTSSIREVGGDFIDYVDPTSIADGVSVIGRMLTDPSYLADRRRNIAKSFKPRGWDQVATTFVDSLKVLELVPPVEAGIPALAEGLLFRPADIANPNLPANTLIANPNRLLIAEHFHKLDRSGAWMVGRFGEVAFRTDLSQGETITLYVKLRPAPSFGDAKVRLIVGDAGPAGSRLVGAAELGTSGLLMARGSVGPGGLCRLILEIEEEGVAPPEEPRDTILALDGLGYARPSNLPARADLLEAFTFVAAFVSKPKLRAAI
jgi:glycosyltransferase involved in cell wall biosynthesis